MSILCRMQLMSCCYVLNCCCYWDFWTLSCLSLLSPFLKRSQKCFAYKRALNWNNLILICWSASNWMMLVMMMMTTMVVAEKKKKKKKIIIRFNQINWASSSKCDEIFSSWHYAANFSPLSLSIASSYYQLTIYICMHSSKKMKMK